MQDNSVTLAEFLSSVIESYKVKHDLSGSETAQLFASTGVFDFLASGYDILHTQSLGYVVSEVEAYIRKEDQG